jgi:hexokinase
VHVITEIDGVPNTRVWADRQERIDHGELIRWTKGFGAPNTEGRDVAAMFRESLEKYVCTVSLVAEAIIGHVDTVLPQNVPAELTALINDTTGTLIASSYVNPRTRIAVIFGTGCNAAYMERIGDIHKIKNLGIDDEANMAINCEWV